MTTKTLSRSRRRLIFGAAAFLAVGLLAAVALWSWSVNGRIAATEVDDPALNAPGEFARVQGYRLHFQRVGDPLTDPTGAPIVLIHGFASSGQEFGRLLPALAEARSLIVPDLLGFGFSERVLTPVPAYSHRGQAALLKDLLDQLGVTQVDLVGSSYGGGIAAQFSLDYPERVRRIVFVDAEIYGTGEGNGAVAYLPFGLNRAVTWTALGGGPVAAQLAELACADAAACLGDGEFTAARAHLTRIRGNTDALIAFSQTPRDKRLPDEIGQVTAPALVVWGEQDQIIAPEFGERLAAALPDARLEWIARAGHVPHLEQPAVVAPLILDFLDDRP